ncbi:nucleotidyltransferase family protein, partial [bacterium]
MQFVSEKESISCVILSAGFSSRFGSFKALYNFIGEPLIEHALSSVSPFCSEIIIVGGHNFEALESYFDRKKDIILIQNSGYKNGMFTSVKAGTKYVSNSRFLVLPVDIPFVKQSTIKKLISTPETSKVLIPSYQGKNGHPVLLNEKLKSIILSADDNSKLNSLIKSSEWEAIDVEDP